MRLAATLTLIFSLFFIPVFAQSERRVAECDGLERWYTGIPVDEYKSAYDAAMDASSARALREYATETLPGFVEAQLRAISADDELCLTMARSYLIFGWSKVNDAVTQIQEGNTVLGLASLSIAMQRIGELRGFVTAHGIDIEFDESGIFFK